MKKEKYNDSNKNKSYRAYQTQTNNYIKKNMSENIAMTEYSRGPFIDYTFLSHRHLLFGKKTKDPKKIRDYNYDLEETLNLNLEILFHMDLLKDKEKDKEIKEIIKKIKIKIIKRK